MDRRKGRLAEDGYWPGKVYSSSSVSQDPSPQLVVSSVHHELSHYHEDRDSDATIKLTDAEVERAAVTTRIQRSSMSLLLSSYSSTYCIRWLGSAG